MRSLTKINVRGLSAWLCTGGRNAGRHRRAPFSPRLSSLPVLCRHGTYVHMEAVPLAFVFSLFGQIHRRAGLGAVAGRVLPVLSVLSVVVVRVVVVVLLEGEPSSAAPCSTAVLASLPLGEEVHLLDALPLDVPDPFLVRRPRVRRRPRTTDVTNW